MHGSYVLFASTIFKKLNIVKNMLHLQIVEDKVARRNDHTREELKELTIQTAVTIVTQEGFNALTARRLAKDIGYTPGTLYNMFGSMDDLCFAVNSRTLDAMWSYITDPSRYADASTMTDQLKTMATLYLEFAAQNTQLWLMVFNHALPQGQKSPPWYREKITNIFAPLEKIIHPLFNEGEEAERALAARVLWSSVHGICYMEETNKTPLITAQSPSEMVFYLIENFINGLYACKKTDRTH
jgi:AcrR family transcriptional regulator